MAGVMTLITVTAVNAFRSLDLFGNGVSKRT
jgi:hypothetical protein